MFDAAASLGATFVADTTAKAVRERQFALAVAGRTVPGLVWTPEVSVADRPVVLIGHGASGSKREGYVVSLARRLVRRHGYVAVAIDGPAHGDRRAGRPEGTEFLDFSAAWSSEATLTDDMVADWRATLDWVQTLPEVGAGPVAYWGLSMGTILGLPLVAAEPRISAAVLGLMGVSGPTKARIAADAAALRCPVLVLMQWHDELFARERTLELFDQVGSEDKHLHIHPGRHGDVPAEAFGETERFLADRLGPVPG